MFILIFEFMERLLVILKLICIDDRERERESLINVYVFCCNIFVCICNINDIIWCFVRYFGIFKNVMKNLYYEFVK